MLERLRSGHQWMVSTCSHLQAPLLLAIRLFWGYYYTKSGVVKICNTDHVIHYFETLGIPCPGIACFLTAWTHLICGVCMMIGFASRLTAIPLAFTMLVAYGTVYTGVILGALEDPSDVVQALPFLFLLSNLIVIAFGAGRWSVDGVLERKWEIETYS